MDQPVETSVADLPFAQFKAMGDAEERGETPPALPAADVPAPEPPEGEAPSPELAAAPVKIDKRTRDGKLLSIQQQIDAETERRYAAKAAADVEEARLTRLKAEAATVAGRPKADAAPNAPVTNQDYKRYMAMPNAPKPEHFTGDTAFEEWQFAVTTHVTRAALAESQQQTQVAAQRRTEAARIQTEGRKLDPAFDEKAATVPVDSRVYPYVSGLDNAHEVILYLHDHPDIAQRITTLTPIVQVGQIGEISGRLKSQAEAVSRGPARVPPISRANPPIKPLGSSPAVTDADDDVGSDTESFSAFKRREDAKDPKLNPRVAARH